MKMTPCAITSQPPGIHIHSCPGTDAGSHAVPDPACGEGNCEAAFASVDMFICIPPCMSRMESSCAEAVDTTETTTSKDMKTEWKREFVNRVFFTRMPQQERR